MSELSYFLIIAISFGAGVIIGWVQRDQDKKRDANINAQRWLESLENYQMYDQEALRDLYKSSMQSLIKLTRIK